jgi:hypothetical protein
MMREDQADMHLPAWNKRAQVPVWAMIEGMAAPQAALLQPVTPGAAAAGTGRDAGIPGTPVTGGLRMQGGQPGSRGPYVCWDAWQIKVAFSNHKKLHWQKEGWLNTVASPEHGSATA